MRKAGPQAGLPAPHFCLHIPTLIRLHHAIAPRIGACLNHATWRDLHHAWRRRNRIRPAGTRADLMAGGQTNPAGRSAACDRPAGNRPDSIRRGYRSSKPECRVSKRGCSIACSGFQLWNRRITSKSSCMSACSWLSLPGVEESTIRTACHRYVRNQSRAERHAWPLTASQLVRFPFTSRKLWRTLSQWNSCVAGNHRRQPGARRRRREHDAILIDRIHAGGVMGHQEVVDLRAHDFRLRLDEYRDDRPTLSPVETPSMHSAR